MSSDQEHDAGDGHSRGLHWAVFPRQAIDTYVEANNLWLTALGLGSATDGPPSVTEHRDPPAVPVTRNATTTSSVSYGADDWTMCRSTDDPATLSVGDRVWFSKSVTESDVETFAGVTGDTNRLHLDSDFARESRFEGRIVHGSLVAGTISAALARFPGLTIYISQEVTFHVPVEIGETVTATCEIVEELAEDRYRVHTDVRNDTDETVVDGEAIVLITESPERSSS